MNIDSRCSFAFFATDEASDKSYLFLPSTSYFVALGVFFAFLGNDVTLFPFEPGLRLSSLMDKNL